MTPRGPKTTRDECVTDQRWTATAATWLEKASARLAWDHGRASGERRWLLGFYASRLLTTVLYWASDLAALVNDEDVEDELERARAVVDVLNRRRLAAKLERVEGRTDAEAARVQGQGRGAPPVTAHAGVNLSCSRCGALLGRLCRDGLGIARRNPGSCRHHQDVPLHVQQAVWRAWEADDAREVARIERDHHVASRSVP